MKSARVITKTNKRAKTLANDGDASVPVIKTKAPVKKSSSKLLKKINARTQFKGIKEALAEVNGSMTDSMGS